MFTLKKISFKTSSQKAKSFNLFKRLIIIIVSVDFSKNFIYFFLKRWLYQLRDVVIHINFYILNIELFNNFILKEK